MDNISVESETHYFLSISQEGRGRNRSECPLVGREVRLRWRSAGTSTRLYTMRYIITVWAYARLLCNVCHWSCCSMAVTLLVRW